MPKEHLKATQPVEQAEANGHCEVPPWALSSVYKSYYYIRGLAVAKIQDSRWFIVININNYKSSRWQ